MESAPELELVPNACHPLCSKIGSFYYMEEKAKLILMDNIVNGVVSMFVTFG